MASRPWHIAFVDLPSGFLFAGYDLAFALMLELLEGEDNTRAAAGYMPEERCRALSVSWAHFWVAG